MHVITEIVKKDNSSILLDPVFTICATRCTTYSASTPCCNISGVRGSGQDTFSVMRNRYGGRWEARVRSLLAEIITGFCRIAEAHNLLEQLWDLYVWHL